jgi:hypothetical protein
MAHAEEGSMHYFMKMVAVAATVVGLTVVSGSAFSQGGDKPKQEPPKTQPKPMDKEAKEKARAEHMAAFAKAFATLKMPLTEAVGIAEKDRKGKAHGADVDMTKDGKLRIEVRLLSGEKGDKWEEVYVDPATKVVTVADKHDEDGDEGEEHH